MIEKKDQVVAVPVLLFEKIMTFIGKNHSYVEVAPIMKEVEASMKLVDKAVVSPEPAPSPQEQAEPQKQG